MEKNVKMRDSSRLGQMFLNMKLTKRKTRENVHGCSEVDLRIGTMTEEDYKICRQRICCGDPTESNSKKRTTNVLTSIFLENI